MAIEVNGSKADALLNASRSGAVTLRGSVTGSKIVLSGPGGVLIHSALGCFFYGAFVAKMLSLTWRESMPRWAVPILGGTVFLG